MDVAYDRIQEEALTPEEEEKAGQEKRERRQSDLNTELRETYQAMAESSWGARLGGFLGSVKKQVWPLFGPT